MLNLGTKITLGATLILVTILISSALGFIHYETVFFNRNIREKADRTLTVLETLHTQAMLRRGNYNDRNPVIATLNATFESLSTTSADMKLWLVMGPKVLAYQQLNHREEQEPPQDEIDRKAIATGQTIIQVMENNMLRMTRPVVLGRGSATAPACITCHGKEMGVVVGEVLGAYSIQLSIAGDQLKLSNTSRAVGILAIVASLVIAMVVSWLLRRFAVGPLLKMTNTMSHLAGGDMGVDIPFIQRSDEIGEMARSVEVFKNTAIEKAIAEESVHQQEIALARVLRRSTLGEMASALAHELGQPLGAIATYSDGLKHRVKANNWSKDEVIEVLDQISSSAHRASRVTRTISEHVRGTEPQKHLQDPAGIIPPIEPLIEAVTRESHVGLQIVNTLPGNARVRINSTEIESVVLNLVGNAVDAMSNTPITERHLEVCTQIMSDCATITVSDTGPGIEAGDDQRLFEPFYTTKPDGIGMGLAICRTIIEAHGGRLFVEPGSKLAASGSRVPSTSISFTLPLADQRRGSINGY